VGRNFKKHLYSYVEKASHILLLVDLEKVSLDLEKVGL
jgi:hypothetical protein